MWMNYYWDINEIIIETWLKWQLKSVKTKELLIKYDLRITIWKM